MLSSCNLMEKKKKRKKKKALLAVSTYPAQDGTQGWPAAALPSLHCPRECRCWGQTWDPEVQTIRLPTKTNHRRGQGRRSFISTWEKARASARVRQLRHLLSGAAWEWVPPGTGYPRSPALGKSLNKAVPGRKTTSHNPEYLQAGIVSWRS